MDKKKDAEKKIFNEKQKREYIDFESRNKQSVEQSLVNYFKRLEPYEQGLGKDIVDMDENEFKGAISYLNIKREESIGTLLSLLKGYNSWARLYNKTKNENVIEQFTPESLRTRQSIITKMLESPIQVKDILNIAVDDKYANLKNRAVMDKLVFWLLYSGMEIKEVQMLKKNDIDYEKKQIIIKENLEHEIKPNVYNIDDNIINLWKHFANAKFLEKKQKKDVKNTKSSEIHQDLVDNDFLFRPIAGKKEPLKKTCMRIAFFSTIISKIFHNYNETKEHKLLVTPLDIKYSGVFYRLYLLEQSGVEITLEIIAKYLNIEYKNKGELLNKVRKWGKDYENWKLAFRYGIIFEEE